MGDRKRRRERQEELKAQLEALCAELAAEVGVEPPVCSVRDTGKPRAGVWLKRHRGRGLLFVSRGLMEKLDPGALRWIVAHELGHVADAEGRRQLRVAGRLTMLLPLACLLTLGLLPMPFGPALAWAIVLGGTAAVIPVRRRLERVADATAYRCCSDDPDAGRRALLTLRSEMRPRGERLFRLGQAIWGYPPFEERLRPA
jgi:Zn-dependent protease with chaperone function